MNNSTIQYGAEEVMNPEVSSNDLITSKEVPSYTEAPEKPGLEIFQREKLPIPGQQPNRSNSYNAPIEPYENERIERRNNTEAKVTEQRGNRLSSASAELPHPSSSMRNDFNQAPQAYYSGFTANETVNPSESAGINRSSTRSENGYTATSSSLPYRSESSQTRSQLRVPTDRGTFQSSLHPDVQLPRLSPYALILLVQNLKRFVPAPTYKNFLQKYTKPKITASNEVQRNQILHDLVASLGSKTFKEALTFSKRTSKEKSKFIMNSFRTLATPSQRKFVNESIKAFVSQGNTAPEDVLQKVLLLIKDLDPNLLQRCLQKVQRTVAAKRSIHANKEKITNEASTVGMSSQASSGTQASSDHRRQKPIGERSSLFQVSGFSARVPSNVTSKNYQPEDRRIRAPSGGASSSNSSSFLKYPAIQLPIAQIRTPTQSSLYPAHQNDDRNARAYSTQSKMPIVLNPKDQLALAESQRGQASASSGLKDTQTRSLVDLEAKKRKLEKQKELQERKKLKLAEREKRKIENTREKELVLKRRKHQNYKALDPESNHRSYSERNAEESNQNSRAIMSTREVRHDRNIAVNTPGIAKLQKTTNIYAISVFQKLFEIPSMQRNIRIYGQKSNSDFFFKGLVLAYVQHIIHLRNISHSEKEGNSSKISLPFSNEMQDGLIHFLVQTIEWLMKSVIHDLVELSTHRKNVQKNRGKVEYSEMIYPRLDEQARINALKDNLYSAIEKLQLLQEAQAEKARGVFKKMSEIDDNFQKMRQKLKRELLKQEKLQPGAVRAVVVKEKAKAIQEFREQSRKTGIEQTQTNYDSVPRYSVTLNEMLTYFQLRTGVSRALWNLL